MKDTQYILSLSYGKDSLACLGAIEKLGLPLDRIITAEVWATDDIQADPPPMLEFKVKADKIIKERWGIEVEHYCAMRNGEKLTYEKLFYHVPERRYVRQPDERERILGFPIMRGNWCNSDLKKAALRKSNIRIPAYNQTMVQETQTGIELSTAFQSRSVEETGAPDSRNRVFSQRLDTRRRYKYCAVFRNRS